MRAAERAALRQEPLAATLIPAASVPVGELLRGDRRMEGETFLAPGYQIRRWIELGRLPQCQLGAVAKVWQPGRLKGIQVAPAHGVPFLTATQVFDIRPQPRKWLAPSKTRDFEGRFVEPGWLLVTCSGSVGDAIRAYGPHVGVLISHDLLRVEPSTDGGYVYSFLRSRLGRQLCRSSHYGNVIKHLEPSHLAAIPLPLVGTALRRQLGSQVDGAFALRDEAYRLVMEAEDLYAAALGNPVLPTIDERGWAVSSQSMSGGRRRLDGYHYNRTAEALQQVLYSRSRAIAPLSDVTERVYWGNRFARQYSDRGVPYFSAEDLFKVNPESGKKLAVSEAAQLGDLRIRVGWLLMACSGQLYGLAGSVALATRRQAAAVVSHDVTRIVPLEASAGAARAGYLWMTLSHPTLGAPLVLRYAYGTQVPHLDPEDVSAVPIARLDPLVEGEIADRVDHAAALRDEADDLEDEAARLAEDAVFALMEQHRPPGMMGVDPRALLEARNG